MNFFNHYSLRHFEYSTHSKMCQYEFEVKLGWYIIKFLINKNKYRILALLILLINLKHRNGLKVTAMIFFFQTSEFLFLKNECFKIILNKLSGLITKSGFSECETLFRFFFKYFLFLFQTNLLVGLMSPMYYHSKIKDCLFSATELLL